MFVAKSLQGWGWRNRFSPHPVAVVDFDPGEAATWRIERLGADGLAAIGERLGAFPDALHGDTAADLIAALCAAVHAEKYGPPAAAGAVGHQIWFRATDPFYASLSVGRAVAFQNWLIGQSKVAPHEVAATIERLIDSCETVALDQTSRAMIAAADARGVPWFRIHQASVDVQFGHGRNQRRMRQALGAGDSALGFNYAQQKLLSFVLLANVGMPVGRFAPISSPDQAAAAATAMGLPVVLKPVDGVHGDGVRVGLADLASVRQAAEELLRATPQIIMQSMLPGDDHRLLVVDGKFVAGARRDPASVTGDGRRTITQLIASANQDPRRGPGFTKLMNLIEIDDELRRVLASQELSLESVPAPGAKVGLRLTANLSTGGEAVDVTETIHPDNIWLAERAAAVIGLQVAGVDFLTTDITRSFRETGGGICEVNAGVGLRPHWLADPKRDVVGPIFETMFPAGSDGRIPTALITGTNGKTTTTRMLDHMLRAAGHVVGAVTTDAVTIDGRVVVEDDLAGLPGANMVLRDPAVTAACLETARGGILRWGLAVDRCNVAALLNVDYEQVGIDGIDTLEAMTELKRKVTDSATDAVVFNAEDARTCALAREYPVDRTILFSLDPSRPEVKAHTAAGGTVVSVVGEGGDAMIVIRGPHGEVPVIAMNAVPATFEGRARHNLANALAAVGLAHGLGLEPQAMASALRDFQPSLDHSNGRFNFIDGLPAKVLIDLATNPPAIRAAVEAIDRFDVAGRRICVFESPGNRPDRQIDDCARAVAGHFDHYVCYERQDWRRGRPAGEIANRLRAALLAEGVAENLVDAHDTQADALKAAAGLAGPDDLLVVLGSDVAPALRQLREAMATA